MWTPCLRRYSPSKVHRAIERIKLFSSAAFVRPHFLHSRETNIMIIIILCLNAAFRRKGGNFNGAKDGGFLCKKVLFFYEYYYIVLACVPFANLTWNIILRHENNGKDFMLRIIKQKSWQKGNSNMHTWLTWINWWNNRVKWQTTTLWFDYILCHFFEVLAWKDLSLNKFKRFDLIET